MAEAADAGSGTALPNSKEQFSAEEELECKICYHDFDLERRIPKLLSCSHSFCQQCLEVLHTGGGRRWRIGCPVCRHLTPVQEYRVENLPDNLALLNALLCVKASGHKDSTDTKELPAQSVSAPTQHDDDSCETCKDIAFITGCVCAIFSFFSVMLLLFLGLIFVHNFDRLASFVGSVCLFTAGVFALFSIIVTWLTCMLK